MRRVTGREGVISLMGKHDWEGGSPPSQNGLLLLTPLDAFNRAAVNRFLTVTFAAFLRMGYMRFAVILHLKNIRTQCDTRLTALAKIPVDYRYLHTTLLNIIGSGTQRIPLCRSREC